MQYQTYFLSLYCFSVAGALVLYTLLSLHLSNDAELPSACDVDIQPAQVKRQAAVQECPLQLTLYVRWFSPNGRTKVNRLLLRPVISVEALQVCLHLLTQPCEPACKLCPR